MNFKQTKLAIGLSLLIILPSFVNAQNENYEAGQKAMHAKQYESAYAHFKKAESDKEYTDAALYWQSYVLYKNKQDAKAKRTIEKLFENHPNSKWIDDAEFLVLEHDLEHKLPNMVELELELKKFKKLKSINSIENIELNEELKLLAIQQIMFEDEIKGLKLVKEMLSKTDDLQVKMNALQIMGINESEQATKELYEFINKNKVIELQNQAVQMLSLRDNLKSNELLINLYEKNPDKELKSSIIQGFIHTENNKNIVELIEKEQDQLLQQQMIEILGIKGASEELKRLSKTLKGVQHQVGLINALALSGDSQSIKNMIETSKDVEIKRQAIQSLIILDDDLGTYLDDLYNKIDDPVLKNEIISVFIAIGKSPKGIQELIKKETNQEIKSQLIHALMAMDDKQELLKVLKVEQDQHAKIEIIHMLGAMGAAEELKKLHESSHDEDLKLEIIQALGIHGSQHNEEFLNQTYDSDNKQVKHSVIEAYMIEGNTEALVQLLNKEEDLEIKKHILQTISMFDPEYILNKLEKTNNKGEQ